MGNLFRECFRACVRVIATTFAIAVLLWCSFLFVSRSPNRHRNSVRVIGRATLRRSCRGTTYSESAAVSDTVPRCAPRSRSLPPDRVEWEALRRTGSYPGLKLYVYDRSSGCCLRPVRYDDMDRSDAVSAEKRWERKEAVRGTKVCQGSIHPRRSNRHRE
ncbi:hypothetical protein BC827DRAFT_954479 [Russula dissimulans]|nr:hypothetical protein BC827DRAFT_954479 [Russula dissimulans]